MSRRGRGQTQDPARCCPLLFLVVQGGNRMAYVWQGCRIWKTRRTPLGLPSLLAFPFPFYFLPLSRAPPSFSLSPSPRRTFPETGAFFIHHGVGVGSGTGCGGLVWAQWQGSFLDGDSGGRGGDEGRGNRTPAASELVGDLGSFLLLGSTFLSTARHCLHYFS